MLHRKWSLGSVTCHLYFCPHSVALGSTEPLTEISEHQGISMWVKCVWRLELTTLPSQLCRMSKYGWKPNIPSTFWTFTACYGKALSFYLPEIATTISWQLLKHVHRTSQWENGEEISQQRPTAVTLRKHRLWKISTALFPAYFLYMQQIQAV